ncbi:MAG: hypothetical protein CVU60_17465 [Deltaproteobacteria bacterium HGW-Deltaproteobacteria-18]|nr:MAG: hypothetical protein CVU60_17465 [Deltaproteobacteria bacterium HGW-Deltaproteobacteria-18]
MTEKKIEELQRANKAQAEALVAAAHQVLVAELKGHPDAKDCPNFELLADVIIADHNFGANAETGAFQTHYDPEQRYPSGLDLSSILARIKSDPESAILLRPAGPKWTPPTNNPWLPEHNNLTLQGQVFKNDAELAAKWEAEAKRREQALRRASNA